MFTGLVQTTGKIKSRKISAKSGSLTVICEDELDSLMYGESIAVNGTCLTLEKSEGRELTFHALAETLKRTNLGSLPLNSIVNIERAMKASDRFGGHIVSGHIDGTGFIRKIEKAGSDWAFSIEFPESIAPYIVEKGSVAIDGISLTIVSVSGNLFTVHIIPVTIKDTALSARKEASPVNLEADIIGKYVRHQLENLFASSAGAKVSHSISEDMLRKAGWEL